MLKFKNQVALFVNYSYTIACCSENTYSKQKLLVYQNTFIWGLYMDTLLISTQVVQLFLYFTNGDRIAWVIAKFTCQKSLQTSYRLFFCGGKYNST